ncbi:MAG: diguanylate cyclase [Sedimentisphaerales bacterium]|nr:diguanylate cyclase [Sedimentisphaerales bacterium]MBN2844268.1 diguanylate cyclase [Sedimentisphaerales bacterium]
MFKINKIFAISLELALIAMSVASLAVTLWLLPGQKLKESQWINQHGRAIAVQFSLALQTGKDKTVENLMNISLEQYPQLGSIAIRSEGRTLMATANHNQLWDSKTQQEKALTNLSFTISRSKGAPLELQLAYKTQDTVWYKTDNFIVSVLVLFGTLIIYLMLIRKMLKKTLPENESESSERVNEIFNTMAEAVVVLDNEENIILANNEFQKLTSKSFPDLKASQINRLNWQDKPETMPWTKAIKNKELVKGIQMTIEMVSGEKRLVVANSTPVKDKDQSINGVMVTLNDITEIHLQNEKIKAAMAELKESHKKIQAQNAALKQMSMQDPLTGCLNRRAFFDIFDTEWSGSKRYGYELSCFMLDIDFFKKINDNHGHSAGDEVLKVVSELIRKMVRKSDHVCRYGGEEFCILLPHTDVASAALAAEKIRQKVEESYPSDIRVTISIGISATCFNANSPQELIDQADKALYYSKDTGRNRYTSWDKLPPEEILSQNGKQSQSLVPDDSESYTYIEIPFQAVNALINALEQRDAMTGMHCRRVADLCVAIARGLMGQVDIYILEVAALLHDIGKISVPDEILNKKTALSDAELVTMSYHLRRGVEIIENSFHSSELTGILKYRGAWYGGTPNKPEIPIGENIPLRSRIIHAATAYDSMVTGSLYRQAKSIDEALAVLKENSPAQFDPLIVARLTEIVTARKEEREYMLPNENEIKALRIGLEIEKLICAAESEDMALMNDLAKSLAKDATTLEIPELAYPAAVLGESIEKGKHMAELLPLVIDIISECNKQNEKIISDILQANAYKEMAIENPTPAESNITD